MIQSGAILVGEICIDFTMPTRVAPTKMRLGGIVHAARALWATGTSYAVGVYCPSYLVDEARAYLSAHGCHEFILLGDIVGAPNVIAIADVREVGHQGYEDLLREKRRAVAATHNTAIDRFDAAVIFPGSYDLESVIRLLGKNTRVTIDIAYDIDTPEAFMKLAGKLANVVISTSSDLFTSIAARTVEPLLTLAKTVGAQQVLLKENRGGSRLFDLATDQVTLIPATLGTTVNSVGVGDAFTAVFGTLAAPPVEAAWRGMQVATAYSQTTYPDDLRRDVRRQFLLSIEVVQGLGGVSVPWHERPDHQIYLAAPDFSYADNPEIDAAASALEYHNFTVRRPIKENGEAAIGSGHATLAPFYSKDVELLGSCSAVFAIPLDRDPGTLIEVGMAIQMGIPVVTWDPRNENGNTMVIVGSSSFSDDIDVCLNGLFTALSKLRMSR
jgi:hypothetical protein